jgi:hypothetical protein
MGTVSPGVFDTLDQLGAASAPATDTSAQPPDTSAPAQDASSAFVSEKTIPAVSFLTQGVQPPSPLYVSIDDILAVTVTNSVPNLALEVSYRMLRSDGQIIVTAHDVFPTSDRAPSGEHIDLPEGWLLGVCVQTKGGGLIRGQCFITIGVQRPPGPGVFRQLQLCSDYLSTRYILGWPGGPNRDSAEGEGAPILYTPAAPAAGAEIVQTAPAATRWHLHTAKFRLTTSAVAGARVVQFALQDGAVNPIYIVNSPATQGPSAVMTYMVSTVGFAPTAFAALTMLPMPPRLPLPLAARWVTQTGNMDAGDQYDQVTFLAEELFD